MRKTAITVGLLVLSASTSVGCKSTSKLAWWKSNKTDETALAHAAPELPSDAAKKAEGAQVAGGAAPFKPANTTGSTAVAAKSGSGYPSTDAPAFTPNVVTQVAATTAPTAGAAGPYDPTATPAPKAASPNVATPGTDRYGLGTSSLAGGAASTPNYGQAPSGGQSTAPNYSPKSDLGGMANQYALPGASTAPTNPTEPSVTPTPTTPGATVAVAQPYRPGGTSTYSVATTPTPSIATRPPVSSAPAGGATTPGTATTPSTTPAPPATTPAPGGNRYW